ncbi:hypothetical protein TI39_contig5869g00002 [Zymoseptoria brevis]|uniref:Uncharacterized protein n=1 Tax=Zymoseptoria brevis TaxID=1047168 RepID=A0A0F4G4V3_9PEZI|nr:hypothetical protein TI39_contig5869g00002 [Zymoseptoria brevis]
MSPSSYYSHDSDDSHYARRRSRRPHRPAHSADHLPRRGARPRRTGSAPASHETSSSGAAAANIGKIALGVVFVQLVSTCISTWMRKKEEESEAEYQKGRRREFDKAKAKRRREEERWERELEEREREKEEARWGREVIVTESRRIAPAPERGQGSDEEEGMRRIEAPPDGDEGSVRAKSRSGQSERAKSRSGESERAKSRSGKSERARSRAAQSSRYSSEDEDERRYARRRPGRSRSRPAVDVS